METWYMTKELGLFHVVFLTDPLYVQWNQFTIIQIKLPMQYHWVTSNVMLFFKRRDMKVFNIVIFLTLKVVLGDHPNRLGKI